jgi:2-keto-4-pentenoate hydratase/2-oxohepta-3-ene-1,7-dioic acid hydratase in catechol pathway
MKVGRFARAGRTMDGIVQHDHVLRISPWHDAQDDWRPFSLPGLTPAQLAELAVHETLPLAELQYLPPMDLAAKIICIGLNYRAHVEEVARQQAAHPGLFLRTLDSLQGHGAPLLRPRASEQYDFEGEITVVIGKPGRAIAREQALEHVFGYTILMDGSVRDYQTHSVTAGKNFWRSGSAGPWIVTADEVPDPSALQISTRLNGSVVQQAGADTMIHDIPALIAYVSSWTPLRAGDLIATGTPAGVGLSRKPPLWLREGDRLEVEVNAIGVLANPIVNET